MELVSELTEVEAAAERLAARVAEVRVDPRQVTEVVRRLARLKSRFAALEAEVGLQGADSGTWRAGGFRSPGEWLASATGSPVGRARDALDTAARLQTLPRTNDRFRAGHLSPDAAREIASAASVAPQAEEQLLRTAEQEGYGGVREQANRVRATAADDAARASRQRRLRRLRQWTDADGMRVLQATMTPAAGAVVAAALDQYQERVFAYARQAGERETFEQYAADALEAMARDALAGGSGGKGLPVGARAKIIVRVDHAALVRGAVADGEVCEIAGLGPVPVSVVREWMDDAFLAAVLVDGVDIRRVVHLGRRATALQQTALQERDLCCVVAGCRQTRRLEIDHREDWARTRHTTLDELDRLCSHHHRLKTRGWALLERGDGAYDLCSPEAVESSGRQPRAG